MENIPTINKLHERSLRAAESVTRETLETNKGMVRSDMSKPVLIFFLNARVHATKSTVKILAAKMHCKYFLKIAEFTHFFCTRNRLYQRLVQSFLAFKHSRDVTALCDALC
jgi:hypothetical protein